MDNTIQKIEQSSADRKRILHHKSNSQFTELTNFTLSNPSSIKKSSRASSVNFSSLKKDFITKVKNLKEKEESLLTQKAKLKSDSDALHQIYKSLESRRKEQENHKNEIELRRKLLSQLFNCSLENKKEELERLKKISYSFIKKQTSHFPKNDLTIRVSEDKPSH